MYVHLIGMLHDIQLDILALLSTVVSVLQTRQQTVDNVQL